MTGMSLLRPCLKQGFRFMLITGRPVGSPLLKHVQLQGQVSVRNGGGGGHAPTIPLRPSQFEWKKFLDDMHFYLLLGFVPMITFVTLVNIFIGPAELSDIPEGYEPKEWEYHESPIKRWFAKYVYDEPQKEYERTLHILHVQRERRYWNQLEKKVRRLQQDRQDYKGWYWVAPDKSVQEGIKTAWENEAKLLGGTR